MIQPTFNLFGYHHNDPDGQRDIRRRAIPKWRLPEAVVWMVDHGVDGFHIDVRYDQAPSSGPMLCHHICSDAACPGGCD